MFSGASQTAPAQMARVHLLQGCDVAAVYVPTEGQLQVSPCRNSAESRTLLSLPAFYIASGLGMFHLPPTAYRPPPFPDPGTLTPAFLTAA
jgi:hypothetical protein